eukprot:Rhum_TRINITY_DN15329_c2_g6::Rhum_TRINITY_DN15329_c2_g6_i8::g.151562::m.151562
MLVDETENTKKRGSLSRKVPKGGTQRRVVSARTIVRRRRPRRRQRLRRARRPVRRPVLPQRRPLRRKRHRRVVAGAYQHRPAASDQQRRPSPRRDRRRAGRHRRAEARVGAAVRVPERVRAGAGAGRAAEARHRSDAAAAAAASGGDPGSSGVAGLPRQRVALKRHRELVLAQAFVGVAGHHQLPLALLLLRDLLLLLPYGGTLVLEVSLPLHDVPLPVRDDAVRRLYFAAEHRDLLLLRVLLDLNRRQLLLQLLVQVCLLVQEVLLSLLRTPLDVVQAHQRQQAAQRDHADEDEEQRRRVGAVALLRRRGRRAAACLLLAPRAPHELSAPLLRRALLAQRGAERHRSGRRGSAALDGPQAGRCVCTHGLFLADAEEVCRGQRRPLHTRRVDPQTVGFAVAARRVARRLPARVGDEVVDARVRLPHAARHARTHLFVRLDGAGDGAGGARFVPLALRGRGAEVFDPAHTSLGARVVCCKPRARVVRVTRCAVLRRTIIVALCRDAAPLAAGHSVADGCVVGLTCSAALHVLRVPLALSRSAASGLVVRGTVHAALPRRGVPPATRDRGAACLTSSRGTGLPALHRRIIPFTISRRSAGGLVVRRTVLTTLHRSRVPHAAGETGTSSLVSCGRTRSTTLHRSVVPLAIRRSSAGDLVFGST